MLSTAAAYLLRMLLAVLAGTVVLSLAVLAVFLVVSAMIADPPPDNGADWGVLY